jgi:diguanylate cyclase
MSAKVDMAVRGPSAYALARSALERLEAAKIWPTALNYELGLHLAADAESELSREIERLLRSGAPLTEEVSLALAATFLPKGKFNEQLHDTGDALTRELVSVSGAVRNAGAAARSFGQTLEAAGRELGQPQGADNGLRAVVDNLSTATRAVQTEHHSLDRRLAESAREVARLKEDLDVVRKDASTDALTNLANRRAFDTQLRLACDDEGERPSTQTIAVALLDVDNFKRFNDTWGHQTGDQVLRFVASVIGRIAAPPRFPARYGGEEFTILYLGESTRQIEHSLAKIREAVAARILRRRSTNEELGSLTVSAGFAERSAGETPDSLMARADAALYVSKRGGRDRTTRSDTLAAAG